MKKLIYSCTLLSGLLIACNQKSTVQSNNPNFDTTFNAQIWKKGSSYVRGRMANDLINSKQLKSMSKDSLIAVLGKPTEESNDFLTYIVSAKDTTLLQNYLLLHIQLDTLNNVAEKYWLTD